MRDFLDLLTHDPRRHDDRVDGARRPVVVRMHFLSTLLSLALVALACVGGSTSVVGSTGGHKPTPTPTATLMPDPASRLNIPFEVKSGVLDIQSNGPLSCAYDDPSVNSVGEPSVFRQSIYGYGGWVVLPTAPQPNYGAGDVQQMRDYLNAVLGSGQPTVPDTLARVQGAPTTSNIAQFSGGNADFFYDRHFCTVGLTIKNTSSSPVQILKAGLRLTATPQPNLHQYRLIDICAPDLIGDDICSGFNGFGPDISCVAYGVEIQLTSGASGEEDLALPKGVSPNGGSCSALVVASDATIHLYLDFTSARPLVYSGNLELKVAQQDQTQTQTLILSQAPTTLVFADPSKFSCDRLQSTSQGATFTLEAQGAAALQGGPTQTQMNVGEACV